jgi:hypothetical protein
MDLKQFGIFLAIMALWLVLNRWVLPRFGISTCLSCGCANDRQCSAPGSDLKKSTGDES